MAPTVSELDSPVSSFRFFDLPAELRTNILSYLLIWGGVHLFIHPRFDPKPDERGKVINIFLVNVQMYQEASAIFYGRNRFILNGRGRLPFCLTGSGGILSRQGHDARRRVQTLDLHLTRVGGEFETKLAPIISDMILSGRLRRLKICLSPPIMSSHARISGPDVDMMAKAPFQALFSLLSDPDLQHVEMWVWRFHPAVFCSFHGETCRRTKGQPSLEVIDSHGLAKVEEPSDWIRVDWEAMVHKFGTNNRIMKITEPDC